MFTQPFIQTQIKESTQAPRHWPLCGEFTGDRNTRKMLPFDDAITRTTGIVCLIWRNKESSGRIKPHT